NKNKKLFDESLSEVMQSLAAFASPPATAVAPTPKAIHDMTTLVTLLRELAVLLREQDSKADTLLQPLSTQLRGQPVEELLQAMTQRLKHYDYEGACETLTEIAQTVGVSLD
ncbi:hypothetical protein, partial [Candidatus Magnetobacterium casense]